MMTKHIKLIVDRITKAKDKKYVNDTIDSIIDSLHDFPSIVEHIGLSREKDIFYIKFDMKVSKTGDLVFVLVKEWLSTIYETEPKLSISINEIEEDSDRGITYRFFDYVPNNDE